jgi:hypothetical protein
VPLKGNIDKGGEDLALMSLASKLYLNSVSKNKYLVAALMLK